jgi:hypothetical protein
MNQAAGNVIWVASYPKSGNTWLRFIIGGLLGFDLNDSTVIEREIPDIHKHPRLQIPRTSRTFIKTHLAFDASPRLAEVAKGVIYVLRNPLDVVASHLNYFGINTDEKRDAFVEAFIQTGGVTRWHNLGMGTWEHNLTSWARAGADTPYVFLRYEDMLEDRTAAVRQVADFLGLRPRQAEIVRVVAATSFNAMSQLETREIAAPNTSFFKNEWQAKKATGFRFMNKGRAGTYTDLLTRTQIARLLDRFGPTMEAAGYNPNDFVHASQVGAENADVQANAPVYSSAKKA